MVIVTLCCALLSLLVSILMGALAGIYYIPFVARSMADLGVTLVELRPLHTTFASAWIYLGCVTCIYWYLCNNFGKPSRGMRRTYRFHMVCWGLAGLAVLVSLALGVTSGREYLGIHPLIAFLILVGWVAFLWNFLRRVLPGFWSRPVYVYMWASGAVLFVYAFIEGYAYLLPSVGRHPVADLQIQWKSCGSLVASFNQMVYGSLLYLGEQYSGDRRIAHSRSAFALFGIGLLNSFTNYGHHTYHIPQDHLIKWVAFIVSMLEVILLAAMLYEIAKGMRARKFESGNLDAAGRLTGLAQRWNLFLLPIAILISIPPLNGLIHGTHVVMAHAMGSAIAIDTYVLLGVSAWILTQVFPKRESLRNIVHCREVDRSITHMNVGLVGIVVSLLLAGLSVGITHYLGMAKPAWLEYFPLLLVGFGLLLGAALIRIMHVWAPLFREPIPHKLFRHDPRWGDASSPEASAEPSPPPAASRGAWERSRS